MSVLVADSHMSKVRCFLARCTVSGMSSMGNSGLYASTAGDNEAASPWQTIAAISGQPAYLTHPGSQLGENLSPQTSLPGSGGTLHKFSALLIDKMIQTINQLFLSLVCSGWLRQLHIGGIFLSSYSWWISHYFCILQ